MPSSSSSLSNAELAHRYRLMVDAVSDYAIYMLDPEGFVVSWNAGAQRLKGYTESDVLGHHFSIFYCPEDITAGTPVRALKTARSTGKFEAEGWRLRKDGSRFWAQVVLHPIWVDQTLLGFAKVTRDLSERRAAEEALRRSEEQLRLLIDAVTDYAIYMLDREGVITSWNSGAQRIKGYGPTEVLGTNFSRFYRREDQDAGLPARNLARAAAEGRFEGEGLRVRKDGSEFWANVVIDPIYDAEGVLRGYAKITRDVTEKRNAQLALEQAREALFQSQKLEAIGQLTGGVAHDFNNLLMVVLTSLELLKRRMPPNPQLHRLVSNAVQGAKRGVSLTQHMLAFARRQELRPEPIDIVSLIYGMHELLERTLGPSISIELDLPNNLSPVLVDAHQLELALLNLAVNGRDAMPGGGTLRITARQEGQGSLSSPDDGHFIRLSVVDSGSGMDSDTLARAVEPFFTTKGVGKGTGLGLAMVQGLAGQSGGRFALESVVGVGTTATLWLPLTQGVGGTTQMEEEDGEILVPTNPQTVLVVDDDPLVLAGSVAMLEDLGHRVLSATSGEQALRLVRENPTINLIVADQAMPKMTGLQLFAALAHERPAFGLVLASGFAEIPEDGPPIFYIRIAKPFDQRELARAIDRALAEHRA